MTAGMNDKPQNSGDLALALMSPVGVILAGGQARRMGGGDKCLMELDHRPLLAHVIDRISPQVSTLIINANGDSARFGDFGCPVAADVIDGFAGPLAGVLTGLEWMAVHRPDSPWLLSVPGDTPFLPADLVTKMADALKSAGADLACARSGGRAHPVVGLWPVSLKEDLRHAMTSEDIRKIDRWTARHKIVEVDFDIGAGDPFFNVNKPEDFGAAEAILKAHE